MALIRYSRAYNKHMAISLKTTIETVFILFILFILILILFILFNININNIYTININITITSGG